MVNPLCPLANPFCGCCLFGLLPRFLSGLLFFLTKRKSGWGICGSSWLVSLFVFWFIWFAYLYGLYWSLYKCLFDCLCSCKDRASEQHRPNARKKKTSPQPLRQGDSAPRRTVQAEVPQLQQSYFRGRKHIGFWTLRSGPFQLRWKLPAYKTQL